MSEAVWPTSPRLPPHLLPDMGFNARYPNRLVSRSYSTDQSVMSRTVSNSTTSYPSMGFVPLQGFTYFFAATLLPTSQYASRDPPRISTRPAEHVHNLVRLLHLCRVVQSIRSSNSCNPSHSYHSTTGKSDSQFFCGRPRYELSQKTKAK